MTVAPASPLSPALPDSTRAPTEHELVHVLGTAYAPVWDFLQRVHTAHPEVVPEWKYSPVVGWHQIYLRGKRRLFYFVPGHDDFRISVILGDRAIHALRHGRGSARVRPLVARAKRYPEGTAFTLTRDGFDPAIAAALLAAKLTPPPSPRRST